MKAVIYARYSSASQREESIEGQVKECTATLSAMATWLLALTQTEPCLAQQTTAQNSSE